MTTFLIGLAGTLIFLALAIISFVNKRFGSFLSFWKYPLFLLPLIVFFWILSTHLYIPFKGNGCSYTDCQDLVEPEHFSANKKSGILLAFIDGFGDCQVNVSMKNGKTYSAKSLNNVFAMVLPAGSGQINEILVGEQGDTLSGEIKFDIKPGNLTYIGSFMSPGGFALLIPVLACKNADYSYKAPTIGQRNILKSWADTDRLVLTSSINNRLKELMDNHNAATQIIGLQFGYLPFNSTSLKGNVKTMTPDEVMKEYKEYEFLCR